MYLKTMDSEAVEKRKIDSSLRSSQSQNVTFSVFQQAHSYILMVWG